MKQGRCGRVTGREPLFLCSAANEREPMNPLRIRMILQALEMTSSDLARETGLSIYYLSRLLNGRIGNPTARTRHRLALGLRQLITDRNVV